MNDETFKLPRLYIDEPLMDKGVIALTSEQAHYLYNVLRRKEGNLVRFFNGADGEWLGALQNLSKKRGEAQLEKQLLPQPHNIKRVHLLFAPIKKNRMDWMIEKAVELGATDFHPILTQNTEVRKLKTERITHQIFEAAEQCERFEIPTLHEVQKLDQLLNEWPKDIEILACLERHEGTTLQPVTQDIAILIGPEGGFTKEEKQKIATATTAITLGEQILRSETATLKALSILNG